MAPPPTATAPTTFTPAGVPCTLSDCTKTYCACAFIYSDHRLPPPPPPLAAAAAQSRMAPFLIATVCILGISFLLLTTCTIILRWRFTRHRRRRGSFDGDAPSDGGDDDAAVVDHPIWHITTVGLNQTVIDSITAFKYKKLDRFLSEKSECTVCLTEFEDGDDLRLLPKCCHAFHMTCIDMWLRSHKNCPLCRAPVVNDEFIGTSFGPTSDRWSRSSRHVDTPLRGSDVVGESSGGDGGNDFGELLPEQRIRIVEILKKDGELRIRSDLGEYCRFKSVDEDEDKGEGVLEPIKRSLSFNAVAASAVSRVDTGLCYFTTSVDNAAGAVQEMKSDVEDGDKRGTSSVSGLLMIKTPSIAPSLQKGSESMKRSVSSGSKLFSFRRTKSHASILPL
ncbi:hypothetical protein vseg_005036 [Gypsophila vaccaria]